MTIIGVRDVYSKEREKDHLECKGILKPKTVMVEACLAVTISDRAVTEVTRHNVRRITCIT